jgi:hypothetical protein
MAENRIKGFNPLDGFFMWQLGNCPLFGHSTPIWCILRKWRGDPTPHTER